MNMIDESFGSFEALKSQINHKCMGVLGAGWGWLVIVCFEVNYSIFWQALDPVDGSLSVEETPNQVLLQMSKGTFSLIEFTFSMLNKDKLPLIGIDVWEHAYILQYATRQDYVDGIFEVLNWEFAENQLKNLAEKHDIKGVIDAKLKA